MFTGAQHHRYAIADRRKDKCARHDAEEGGEHEAVQVKYVDDNYVELYDDKIPEEKSLVLDVSFWNMVPYMPVNYVGGWKYREN